MKRIYLILVVGLIFNQLCAKETLTEREATKVLTENNVEKQITELKEQVQLIDKKIDLHKATEDCFSSALSDQSTRFSLIAASLLVILGGLSYGINKYEVENIKKTIEEKIKIHEKQESEFIKKASETIKRNYTTSGNTNRLIAEFFKTKEKFYSEFLYSVSAACQHKKSLDCYEDLSIVRNEKDEKAIVEVVIANLEISLDCLTKRIPANYKFSNNDTEKIYEDLETLSNSKIKDILDYTAKLRVEFNNKIEQK